MALIYCGLVAMTFKIFFVNFEPSIGLVYFKILFAFKEYSFHEKLMKNMGPHCTVRPGMLTMAFTMALTLEPIKSLCTISTMRLVFLHDGLAQSPSEAVPLDFQEGPGVQSSWMGSLWHFGRTMYEIVSAFSLVHRVTGFPPQTLLVFRTIS